MNKRIKLAYLTLGIGIGMIFTNILYSFNPNIKYLDLEDEAIIEKAKELGMVNLKESIEVENIKEDPIEEKKEDEVIEPIIETEIIVESGSNLTRVAKNLYDANLIKDVDEFVLFVKGKKLDKKIRTGRYKIKSNSSYDDIIEILTRRLN
ncbi:YceG-like family protein [Tissierella praeacuta DSM 18095]|uniref:YceG-like family protein n=1 Tax=Tissierella praeacuta DSM 18095 TaxID=1123404 RepID=A0A1M4ZFG1_9FIRM|nr:endolytic transglycosylase MltG [Tissierella praeacuta]SHF16750.1 YceG-like family protein [Tissierella praeacuta DSM 18095]SUP01947.1 YceG-like family [Tissierella praeacuta]